MLGTRSWAKIKGGRQGRGAETEIEIQARILSACFRELLAGIRKENPVQSPKKGWQERSSVLIRRHPRAETCTVAYISQLSTNALKTCPGRPVTGESKPYICLMDSHNCGKGILVPFSR